MLQNDRLIKISAAGSRFAARWPAQELCLQDLYSKLAVPVRSNETGAAYLALKKRQQDDLKDVGGFVGGVLAGGIRKAGNVSGRDLITLDIDRVAAGGTKDILRRLSSLGCGWAAYSTRKHAPDAPRLRALIPTDRTLTADEYEPAARKIAFLIDPTMEVFDRTTFEAVRLMYWPSVCSDAEYICEYEDKPLLSADGLLAMFGDWRDTAQWPQVPGAGEELHKAAEKAEDPTTKPGVVGAFCRTYSVLDVLEKYLPGVYEPVDNSPDRYTYSGGSTTGGAIVYNNGLYLYSHHATDPASGRLCNAFDLVRLHVYGTQDDEIKANTPANKYPSYASMCRLAVSDDTVSTLLDQERYDKATADFEAPPMDAAQDDIEWKKRLARNPMTGAYDKTADNILLILENDRYLKNRILLDEFAGRGQAVGPYPWDTNLGERLWSDNDDSGVRWYLEKVYQITGKEKIMDAVSICGRRHAFDPVKQYLESLTWDGTLRLDSLFIDYLGAEDNLYTRAVTRKAFCAAVARVMAPGVKFDNMTILTGAQGIGKSTLLRKMGKSWFSDSLKTFEGKEACEMVQGVWILEVGELEAMARSEIGRIKQFLSQQEDIFRAAYGRRTQWNPRRCIFFGTSNNSEYLRDRTGNRRFWPVDVGTHPQSKNVFKDLDGELEQLWAEAVLRWRMGEPLYLSGQAEALAKESQEEHRERSPREGIIRDFVEQSIPADWLKWDIVRRRIFWGGSMHEVAGQLLPRERVCALEVWCEALGGDMKNMRYQDAQEINNVIGSMDGWERTKNGARFGYCGLQKGFMRVLL